MKDSEPIRAKANSGQLSPGGKKDAERLQFIEWLALPSDLRSPKTQTELALQLGVDAGTLSDWKKLPGFHDEVRKRVNELVKDEHADVGHAMITSAKSGDVPAQKLSFEYIQEWSEKTRHDVTTTQPIIVNLAEISPEQLRELDARIAASHRERS